MFLTTGDKHGSSISLADRTSDTDASVGRRFSASATGDSAKIYAAFKLFDTDNSGSLSVEEMTAILSKDTGSNLLTPEQIKDLIAEFDKNGDGELDIKEFTSAFGKFSGAIA